MSDPANIRPLVAELAADGCAHGHGPISSSQVEQVAALPVDLWAAARKGITPDHWGYSAHLPRAALDIISAPLPWSPGSRRRRPRRWQHRQ